MPLSADVDPEAAIAVLEKLASRLAADGWQVRLHAPAGDLDQAAASIGRVLASRTGGR